MDEPKIMVMGVGNLLLSDEGLGVHFLKELNKDPLPGHVELLDGGTAGLELIPIIQEVDYLIIVDAISTNKEVGTIIRFQPDDALLMIQKPEVSFHQVGILEVLRMANLTGSVPPTIIYGVQPKLLDWGLELSTEIQSVFSKLKDLIHLEIKSILEKGQNSKIHK